MRDVGVWPTRRGASVQLCTAWGFPVLPARMHLPALLCMNECGVGRIECNMSDHTPNLLAHLVVGVAAHVSQGVAPRHLGATLGCVASWRRVSISVALTIYTNERAAVASVVRSSLPPPSPPVWRAAVVVGAHLHEVGR